LPSFFSANYLGESDSPNVDYLSHVTGVTEAGDYNIQYEVSGGVLTSATINGHTALVDPATWQITGNGGTAEAGLAIRVENRADGTYGNSNSKASDAINVHLKLGKTGELVNILDEITGEQGPLNILEDNYKTIMKNIDSKIDREERRIDLKEQMLKERYARLDELLGNYAGKQAQLASNINQMAKQ